jgi:hypothetical protein
VWRWLPDVRHTSSELAENAKAQLAVGANRAARTRTVGNLRPFAIRASAALSNAARRGTSGAGAPAPRSSGVGHEQTVAPSTPAPAPSVVTPAPPQPRASPGGDLASYIESRRRERGESIAAAPSSESPAVSPTPENENARANRIAAANLGLDKRPTFGADANRGGGIFSIQRMSYDYAEFLSSAGTRISDVTPHS